MGNKPKHYPSPYELYPNDKWTFYQVNGEWRWTRKASNGKIVGASTEGYHNKRDCIWNAERHGYIKGVSKEL